MEFTKAMFGIWNIVPPIKIPNTQYTLMGFSVAARKTNFMIPELDIMLDCGLPSKQVPEHIFITHCHGDHCFNLPMTIVDTGDKRPTIYVPKKKLDHLRGFIHATYVMSSGSLTPKIHHKYIMKGVVGGSMFELAKKNRKWLVQVIQCYHRVPCVGYGFSDIRQKLKKEYTGLSGKKIVELKKKGIEITEEIIVPLFCYIGDTTKKVLDNEGDKLEIYPMVIIECTFLYKEHLIDAKKKNHMHWDHLKCFIEKHPDIMFVLYHFSAQYKDEEIREFFKEISLPNIHPWVVPKN